MNAFSHVTFLHGLDDLPNGSVERLQTILAKECRNVSFSRPLIPPGLPAEDAFTSMLEYSTWIKPYSLLVGLGRGGLIANAIQCSRPALSLSTFVINAPTQEDGLLSMPWTDRVALYSSLYPPIRGRCLWDRFAGQDFDVPWLAHGVEMAYYSVAAIIVAHMEQRDLAKEIALTMPVGVQ
jgi:hypothetical protein